LYSKSELTRNTSEKPLNKTLDKKRIRKEIKSLQETRVVNENVIVYSNDLKLYLINIEKGEKGLGTTSSAAICSMDVWPQVLQLLNT